MSSENDKKRWRLVREGGKYELPENNEVSIFVNGFKIDSLFDFMKEERGFRRAICAQGDDKIPQSEVVVVVKNGALIKEVRIHGFFRLIRIGDWE